jgi:hypothetical protein
MNKRRPKDLLTQKQFEIAHAAKISESKTRDWLKQQSIKPTALIDTDIRLLKAQQAATHLLQHFQHQLTDEEVNTLRRFKRAMNKKQARDKLRPQAAYSVLNINSKIHRHIYKLRRQQTQA